MPLYPIRALERAMKIKEVITRAMGGLITWIEAAEIIGITDKKIAKKLKTHKLTLKLKVEASVKSIARKGFKAVRAGR